MTTTLIKLMVLIFILLIGCTNFSDSQEKPFQKHFLNEPLKIGYISDSSNEKDTAEGIAIVLAIHDINQAYKQLNKENPTFNLLKLFNKDGKGDTIISAKVAEDLVNEDNVSAIIGPSTSDTTIKVFNTLKSKSYEILQITHSATAPNIGYSDDEDRPKADDLLDCTSDATSNSTRDEVDDAKFMVDKEHRLFRTIISDNIVGVALDKMLDELRYNRPAVLFVDNAYGQGLCRILNVSIQERGGKITHKLPYTKNPTLKTYSDTDLYEIFQPLHFETNDHEYPDVLVLIGYQNMLSQAVPYAIKKGLINNFFYVDRDIGLDLIKKQSSWQELWENNSIFGVSPAAEPSGANSVFENNYQNFCENQHGFPCPFKGTYTAHIYDAAILLGLAVVKAETTTDIEAIRKAVTEVSKPPGVPVGLDPQLDFHSIETALRLILEDVDINYEGAAGPQDFDKNGDVQADVMVWKILKNCGVYSVREDGWITPSGIYNPKNSPSTRAPCPK
jgi:ABC-type branched-subunit amino acid transport system substrate-binding protein